MLWSFSLLILPKGNDQVKFSSRSGTLVQGALCRSVAWGFLDFEAVGGYIFDPFFNVFPLFLHGCRGVPTTYADNF